MSSERLTLLILAAVVVIGITGFYARHYLDHRPASLAERCSDQGGEWVYKSADLLCLMPDGSKFSYSAAVDGFVPFAEGGVVARAQAAAPAQATAACDLESGAPAYPSEQTFTGRPTVDFSTNPAAWHYRTAIRQDVARGVNFAGAYVVSTWGCGAGCVGSAVINAETGKILEYGLTASGFMFQPDSGLLVASGQGSYAVENDHLIQICE